MISVSRHLDQIDPDDRGINFVCMVGTGRLKGLSFLGNTQVR